MVSDIKPKFKRLGEFMRKIKATPQFIYIDSKDGLQALEVFY